MSFILSYVYHIYLSFQPSDLASQASIYQTANATASTFGGGPFSRLDANNKTKME